MAVAEKIGIELIEELVDQFDKSYDKMTSHQESLTHSKCLMEDIKQHIINMQVSLEEKFDELATKERAFEKMKSEHHALLAERETAVVSEEQSICDRLQEVRDAAVSTIIEARTKAAEASPVVEIKVSTPSNVTLNAPFPAPEESIPFNKPNHSAEASAREIDLRSQLKQLCEEMNVEGLLKFFSDNRRNITLLRDELPVALKSANEPAHFVLKTLEGFYPQNPSVINPNSKEYSNRRTCLLLMESATPLLAMAGPGDDHLLSDEIKKRAKVVADEWKHKLAELDIDDSNGHSLEAHAFLQLLATFNISAEFDEDELCKLVIAMSRRRRQAPELCLAIGLAHKSQDLVGGLITKGRLIDAVQFSYFFGLADAFPLVPLLKRYMDDVEETCTRSIAAGLEKEAANQELSALKTVIRCIEEYKLQEEYPLLPLQNRIDQLEKTRSGKKRMADMTYGPTKKHQLYGGHPFHRAPNRFSGHSVYERTRYYTGPDRYPYTAPPPYNASGPPAPYNGRVPPYGMPSTYGPGPPMQPVIPGGNYVGPGMMQPASNYGSYMSNNVPSSQQPYLQYEE